MLYALIFNVLKGGTLDPLKWGKEDFLPDRSVILLDEFTPAVWLWHGEKQGLVARRIAMRQAESLKGHGYVMEKTIVGRDIKKIKEIDQRKLGKEPETDSLNEELQKILNRNYDKLDDYVVSFQLSESEMKIARPVIKSIKQSSKVETEQVLESQPKALVKTESKPKSIHLKQPEYAFESNIEQSISKDKILEISPEIKNILNRIDKIEKKLDILTRDFDNFKKSLKTE